jgi:hypothetical protein
MIVGIKLMANDNGVTAMANKKLRGITAIFAVSALLVAQFAAAGVNKINNFGTDGEVAILAFAGANPVTGRAAESFDEISKAGDFRTGGGKPGFNDANTWAAQSKGKIEHAYAQDGVAFSPIQTPVPEPETYAMMLVGLGLLGLSARSKKQI